MVGGGHILKSHTHEFKACTVLNLHSVSVFKSTMGLFVFLLFLHFTKGHDAHAAQSVSGVCFRRWAGRDPVTPRPRVLFKIVSYTEKANRLIGSTFDVPYITSLKGRPFLIKKYKNPKIKKKIHKKTKCGVK